jgi:hypothetical protein
MPTLDQLITEFRRSWDGDYVVTPGAAAIVTPSIAQGLLTRHFNGDWGIYQDWDVNTLSLRDQGMIMSVYVCLTSNGLNAETVWVITDPGWETTTILLPSEY